MLFLKKGEKEFDLYDYSLANVTEFKGGFTLEKTDFLWENLKKEQTSEFKTVDELKSFVINIRSEWDKSIDKSLENLNKSMDSDYNPEPPKIVTNKTDNIEKKEITQSQINEFHKILNTNTAKNVNSIDFTNNIENKLKPANDKLLLENKTALFENNDNNLNDHTPIFHNNSKTIFENEFNENQDLRAPEMNYETFKSYYSKMQEEEEKKNKRKQKMEIEEANENESVEFWKNKYEEEKKEKDKWKGHSKNCLSRQKEILGNMAAKDGPFQEVEKDLNEDKKSDKLEKNEKAFNNEAIFRFSLEHDTIQMLLFCFFLAKGWKDKYKKRSKKNNCKGKKRKLSEMQDDSTKKIDDKGKQEKDENITDIDMDDEENKQNQKIASTQTNDTNTIEKDFTKEEMEEIIQFVCDNGKDGKDKKHMNQYLYLVRFNFTKWEKEFSSYLFQFLSHF